MQTLHLLDTAGHNLAVPLFSAERTSHVELEIEY